MINQFIFDSGGLSSEVESSGLTTQQIGSIEQAQEIIYCFFLDIVKQKQPQAVLQEFRHLFIGDNDSAISNPVQAIYEIVFHNKQSEFHYTIKRCCYILINNWLAKRDNTCIQKLIELFQDPIIRRKSLSPLINRLRNWIQIFVETTDYQELEIYAQTKTKINKTQTNQSLSKRYPSILLSNQSNDLTNSIEQREAAKNKAIQLRCRFKFDLAIYLARFESFNTKSILENPTEVGDEVLRIIKIIVAKRDTSNYTKLADSFTAQVRTKKYKEFKSYLQKYLISSGDQVFVEILKESLLVKLNSLYEKHDEQVLTDKLLEKTCNKLIELLTVENRCKPSQLLKKLMVEVHPLTLVILLLKIVLICRPSRTHLESCIAELIKYYDNYPEETIWMSNFMEIFNIMFAIYADNMVI